MTQGSPFAALVPGTPEWRLHRRLREERTLWLTTVDGAGRPYPSVVWYLWDGESILVYSRPGRQRLTNIARNPRVAINLDTDGRGGDVVVIQGMATIDEAAPRADSIADWTSRYAWGFERHGWTAEQFAADYSVAVWIRLTKIIRGL